MAPSGPTSMPGSPVSSSVTTTGGPKAARAGAVRAKASAYAQRRVVMRWTMPHRPARRDRARDHVDEGAVRKKSGETAPAFTATRRTSYHTTKGGRGAKPPRRFNSDGDDRLTTARGAISLP